MADETPIQASGRQVSTFVAQIARSAGDLAAALGQIMAPTLVLPSASDRLLGVDGARQIRDGVKQASYAEIPSDLGHRAARAAPGTPEGEFIDHQIRALLAKVE